MVSDGIELTEVDHCDTSEIVSLSLVSECYGGGGGVNEGTAKDESMALRETGTMEQGLKARIGTEIIHS